MNSVIPNPSNNIYPTNKENIRAILNFYFQIPDGNLEPLFKQRKLVTNQIEFIAQQVSSNLSFIENNVGNSGLTISNVMKYGIEALTIVERDWNGSQNRKRITREFKELIFKKLNINPESN